MKSDYPKLKKKGKREVGIRFPSLKEGTIEYDKDSRRKAWVTLPKIGRLRFVSSRPFSGKNILEKAFGATVPNALQGENPDKNPPL